MKYTPGITQKVFAIAASVLLLLLLIAANTHHKIRSVNAEINYLARYIIPVVQLIDDATIAMLEQEIHVERILSWQQQPVRQSHLVDAEKALWHQQYNQADRLLAEAVKQLTLADNRVPASLHTAPDSAILRAVEQIRSANQRYYAHTRALLQEDAQNTASSEKHLPGQTLSQEENALNRIAEDALSQLQNYAITTSQRAQLHQESVLLQNTLLTLITLITGMVYAAILSKKLSRPVTELNQQINHLLAQEQLSQVQARSHDEVAVLTQRFNLALDTLRRAEHLKDVFGLYLDPQLIEQLEQRTLDYNVAGERQCVTVILSNLEGVDALANNLSAEQFIRLLNQYLDIQLGISREFRGILNFSLTEILSFWTHPFSEQHTQNNLACHMLLSQLTGVAQFTQIVQKQYPNNVTDNAMQFRAGLASGELVVANMGPSGARSFTVIGDEVNAASRLKGVARFFKVNLVLSEDVVGSLDEAFIIRPLGWVKVPGKDDPIKVFHLMGYRKDYSPHSLAQLDSYVEGLRLFESRQLPEATSLFQEYLTSQPEDIAAKKYLALCQQWQNGLEPPADTFYWEIAQK
ncbi:adenylate/guanylate cyclase domain-containing protein [Planctobacterium marinum]|uniref:adenylate/guanylate cyclase domain-containing protein n=1 Tax=Planctobacterium marinum TaxID=1631968 RepID=UPI001E62F1A3|nr:adenylate/guanylate cyclase domain-containing protein [Planctobacterium marinum]MCC2608128.1 hypothetical protein [Planctobacterium marinum]